MMDRAARTQEEIDARKRVVEVAMSILTGSMTYLDGAEHIWSLSHAVGGVANDDPDFRAFSVISSETDHLPLKRTRHLWSPAALQRLEPELKRTEGWARGVGLKACENLIARFRSVS